MRAFLEPAAKRLGRRVLGVDPGLASCGYGIVDYYGGRFSSVCYGVIETSPNDGRSSRLLAIYREFSRIVEAFAPDEAGMETLYFAKNVTSALAVAEARGVVSMCLAEHGIGLTEHSPATIKKTVSGAAQADKLAVQKAVRLLLGLSEIPRPDHAADALAAAITHVNCPQDGHALDALCGKAPLAPVGH